MRTRGLLGVAVASIALACGDVPTLPGGVAYITPVITPSPAVAWGDTLRDSLGRAAPLRVYAIDRAGDTIRTITVRYVLTSLTAGATLAGEGLLVAPDTLGSLRLVAQVTSAAGVPLQLQTAELTIPVVPRATVMTRSDTTDTLTATLSPTVAVRRELAVTVRGTTPAGSIGTVEGIPVHFTIAAVYPAATTSLRRFFYLTNGTSVQRPDSTMATDTTGSNGVASRTLVALGSPDATADSIRVTATARMQRGVAFPPVSFTVRFSR